MTKRCNATASQPPENPQSGFSNGSRDGMNR